MFFVRLMQNSFLLIAGCRLSSSVYHTNSEPHDFMALSGTQHSPPLCLTGVCSCCWLSGDSDWRTQRVNLQFAIQPNVWLYLENCDSYGDAGDDNCVLFDQLYNVCKAAVDFLHGEGRQENVSRGKCGIFLIASWLAHIPTPLLVPASTKYLCCCNTGLDKSYFWWRRESPWSRCSLWIHSTSATTKAD